MSRILAVVGIVGAVALGSCVSQRATLNDGLAWSYQNNPGEGPKLAYGAPMSDNVVLMMTCDAGEGRARLSLLGGSPEAGLVLASGRESTRFGGEAVASPGAGHLIETTAPLDATLLARFQRTGDLTLVDRSRSIRIDAEGSERADVKRFFKACEQRTA